MGKYIEQDTERSVPGAFGNGSPRGIRRSPTAWVNYLNRKVSYLNDLYIYVEEEYGYRAFLWIYPGDKEALVDDWVKGRTPWLVDYDHKGEFIPVDFTTCASDRYKPYPRKLELVACDSGQVIKGFSELAHFDGLAHIHEEDDSYLKIEYYEVRGIKHPKVEMHILDALAAI